MLAAYRRSMRHGFEAADAARLGAVAEPEVAEARLRTSGFATAKQPNWSAIAMIVALHAGLLVALVKLDILHVVHEPAKATVVTLVPLEVAPPPPPPETKIEPIKPIVARIVAPPPLVTIPAPSPPPVATSPVPPPLQAIVVAPSAADPGPPAPVTPPDASAASLKNPSPRYPLEARRHHEEGTVRLRVIITEDGRVKDISVARSSGFDRLDDAALEAVRRWKFMPGTQAGKPVEALGFLSIPFRLSA